MLRFLLFLTLQLSALPSNPTIIHGSAQFHWEPALLRIDASDRAIIDWDSFSIEEDELVQVHFANPEDSMMNQTAKPSHLLGRIESNGQVVLVGIAIKGPRATFRTSSFVSTSYPLNMDLYLTEKKLSWVEEGALYHGFIRPLPGEVVFLSPPTH